MVTKEQLDEYLEAYQHGSPLIDDSTYDALLEEYLREHGEDKRPFTRNKQSSEVNDVLCTLPKTYGCTTPMRPGQKTYKEWIEKQHLTSNVLTSNVVVVQPKFDGCSVAYSVLERKFYTRGDLDNGESVDVTDLFHHCIGWIERVLRTSHLADAVSIKFEAIMDESTYVSKYASHYKRARDAVSATITSRNITFAHDITLVPLRIYRGGEQYLEHSFETLCLRVPSDDYTDIQNFITTLLSNQAMVNISGKHYACDGVVVSVVKSFRSYEMYQGNDDTMNISPLRVDPEREVAIKILNLVTKTKLRNIMWQFGKSGRITPVAIVDPVQIENVTITNIGLSTFERVVDMNLRYGDTVSIMYNIVPYFVGSDHDGGLPIPIPNKCPMCGHPLDTRHLKQVQCTNPNCDGKRLGNIIRYCEKMGMFGVSEGVITKLWDHGIVRCISDLYTKDLMVAANIDGLGERSMQNVIKSIRDASTNVHIYRWLGALPCNSVSAKKWKTVLFSVYGVNLDVMRKDVYALCHEPTPQKFLEKMLWNTTGIGPVTASSINSGIMDCWNDIVKMIDSIKFNTDDEIMHNVVCMSGTRDADVKALLMSHGFEISDTWTKNCVALVVPDKSFNSKKVQQCRDAGKPIYTIDEIRRGAL